MQHGFLARRIQLPNHPARVTATVGVRSPLRYAIEVSNRISENPCGRRISPITAGPALWTEAVKHGFIPPRIHFEHDAYTVSAPFLSCPVQVSSAVTHHSVPRKLTIR